MIAKTIYDFIKQSAKEGIILQFCPGVQDDDMFRVKMTRFGCPNHSAQLCVSDFETKNERLPEELLCLRLEHLKRQLP